MTRDELVKKVAAAMASENDTGGYERMRDILAHIAIKEIEYQEFLRGSVLSTYHIRGVEDRRPYLATREAEKSHK